MCMCVCVCVCVCACVRMYVFVSVCVCVWKCVNARVHVCLIHKKLLWTEVSARFVSSAFPVSPRKPSDCISVQGVNNQFSSLFCIYPCQSELEDLRHKNRTCIAYTQHWQSSCLTVNSNFVHVDILLWQFQTTHTKTTCKELALDQQWDPTVRSEREDTQGGRQTLHADVTFESVLLKALRTSWCPQTEK